MILLDNGKLIVCGGKSDIIKTSLVFPSGFILEIDTSFSQEPVIIRKNLLKFVWSLAVHKNKLYATAFNGRTSKILISEKYPLTFKKLFKVKALVHKLKIQHDTIWLMGSKSIHFRKDGWTGFFSNDTLVTFDIPGKGCVWNISCFQNKNLIFTDDGSILKYDAACWTPYQLKSGRAIYVVKEINNGKILLAGNGKTIFFLRNH